MAWRPAADLRANRIHPQRFARAKRQEAGIIADTIALDSHQRWRHIPPVVRSILRRRCHLSRPERAPPISRTRSRIWGLSLDAPMLDANAMAVLILRLPHTYLLRRVPTDCPGQRGVADPRSTHWGSLPQAKCETRHLGS